MQKRLITPALGLVLVLIACESTTPDAEDAGSTTSSSGAATSGCGVIEPSTTACGTCLSAKCCAEGKACEPDAACKSCVARGADSLADASCKANTLYDGVYQCVNGPCAAECGGGTSTSSGGSGGSCNSTSCNEGPAGDSLCKSKGCGACSFGSCLVF